MDKEVYFGIYCQRCKHSDKDAIEDPCFECLQHPSNKDSHVPVEYDAINKEEFDNGREK